MTPTIDKGCFKMVLFLMTNRCNLSCRHCYVTSSPHGEFGFDIGKMRHLLKEIQSELGSVRIALSGGEPLTRSEDALDFLEAANKLHPLLLLTNGTLITQKMADKLSKLNMTIRISLDGYSAETHDLIRGKGSFKKSIKGIQNLQNSGFPLENIELFAMIPPEGVDGLPKVLSLAEDLGIRKMKIEPIAKTGRALEFWSNYSSQPDPETQEYRFLFFGGNHLNFLEKWRIEQINDLAFDVLNIYSDGTVYPYTFQGDEDKELGALGNVNSESLREILSQDRLSKSIVDKFIRTARGPERSLAAMRLTYIG
ncbi:MULTISPECIES: radical SAM protein [Pseudomonas]|uniref:radical SAM protein n=1 Tax=Pseudomonas TaxID=286 RepID=UPI00029CEA74|nr:MULTISPECIES: radical SAM protein [Pseudomonas]AFY19327.1 hypothetical protein PputUW4_02126 [Pseudomonas sp. UW4]MDF9775387.1 MoaA/NifB/PqqE/SkfB family radical SAM enzyme [Pseudomonas baetica]